MKPWQCRTCGGVRLPFHRCPPLTLSEPAPVPPPELIADIDAQMADMQQRNSRQRYLHQRADPQWYEAKLAKNRETAQRRGRGKINEYERTRVVSDAERTKRRFRQAAWQTQPRFELSCAVCRVDFIGSYTQARKALSGGASICSPQCKSIFCRSRLVLRLPLPQPPIPPAKKSGWWSRETLQMRRDIAANRTLVKQIERMIHAPNED